MSGHQEPAKHDKPISRSEFIEIYKHFIRDSKIPVRDAIVGAGGSCLLFGVRKETADMDLSIPSKEFKSFVDSGKYPTHVFGKGTEHEVLVVEWSSVIDLHATVGNPETMIVDGVCTWTPEYTLAFKKRMNRPKDQDDIKRLEELIKKGKYNFNHGSYHW